MNVLAIEKVIELKSLVTQGLGVRSVVRALGVAKGTVARYRHELISERGGVILCACGQRIGHKGWCSYRVSLSPARKAFLESHPSFGLRQRAVKKKPVQIDRFLRWPYVVYGKNVPDVVIQIHEAVPINIPEKIRPDVCQDIIVDILEGLLTVSDIPNVLRKYINSAYKKIGDYRARSIYDDVRGHEGLVLLDTLSYENRLWQ
jgi:hypothetical protein